MFLYQKTNTDFILVGAEWRVEQALLLVLNLQSGHVIVKRQEKNDQEYYYLYDKADFLDHLKAANVQTSVKQALNLRESESEKIIPDTLSIAKAPPRGVVRSGNRLTGFWEESKSFRGPTPLVERSLLAKFPMTVPLNETRILTVYLTGAGAGIPFKTKVPLNSQVDIKVEAKNGFVIEGTDRGQLRVTDNPNDPNAKLTFKLRGTAKGTGEILVWASLNGFILAGLSITPQVEAEPVPREESIEHLDPLAGPPSRTPDLFLKILERWENGNRGFTMEIHGPQYQIYMKEYGFIPFTQDPGKYFEEFYQDIESFPVSTAQESEHTVAKLEDKGNDLFEKLFPPELRQLLWELRQRIDSVFIQSDEPWIPWELCRLSGEVNGKIEEGDFWCETFALTRWIRTINRQSIKVTEDLTLNRIATVVPTNSGLPYAADEEKFLSGLNREKRKVYPIPARFMELQRELASGLYDGWHFTGHGRYCHSNPDLSAIQLEDEPLKPENLGGKVENLGRNKPFVFLNACQIGRGGMSLTGIGGWASRFLAAGAGAFIGPLWSVYDQSSCTFTKVLYSELFKGNTIGEAVRTARGKIKGAGDPTWLAYTVFAYPMASVKP
jgi:CHAT domain/Ternary complex associated domain 7